jgi:hypothetical protein
MQEPYQYSEEDYLAAGGELESDESDETEFECDISDEEFIKDTTTIEHFYVDPNKMLDAYVVYKQQREEALANGAEDYPIPKYLVECIIKISNHLSYRYNFINYSYRSDMVAEGVESCLRGFNSYDPAISKYIFAYFTRACFNAFVRRIQKEQTQSEIKGKLISNLDVDSIVTQSQESGEFDAEFIEYMKIAQDFKVRPDKPKLEKEVKKNPNQPPELIFDE